MTRRIPALFMRGGSSKGVLLEARDLPADARERDALLLTILGSPDPYGRQLNGMGGGLSSLSKAAIIAPSQRGDADVDFTFAQVAVDRPVVDYGATCGNLASAVGPFAVDRGLVRVADGEATVRIFLTNTRKVCHATFAVSGGEPVEHGDYEIAGVAGTGARIQLDFLDPGGSATCGLLPTGRVTDEIDLPDAGRFTVSLVDATNPVVFVAASAVQARATAAPAEIDGDRRLMALLDQLRRAGGVRMGLGNTPQEVGLANPKIAMIGPPETFTTISDEQVPADETDILVRIVSMEKCHRAVTLTGAMCIAAATKLVGSLPHAMARPGVTDVRVGSPSGVLPVSAHVTRTGEAWRVDSCRVWRTARRLMSGEVFA
jgi:2-methylaconitate cis-trans-isomerase PrpF